MTIRCLAKVQQDQRLSLLNRVSEYYRRRIASLPEADDFRFSAICRKIGADRAYDERYNELNGR